MSIELRGLIAAIIAGVVSVGLAIGIAGIITHGALPASVSPAQTASAAAALPTDPADLQSEIISGGKHFSTSCAGCHGEDGSGGGGAPNLHNEDMSDQEIFSIISTGKGPMPPFAGTYNPTQINSIVAYVRSLK